MFFFVVMPILILIHFKKGDECPTVCDINIKKLPSSILFEYFTHISSFNFRAAVQACSMMAAWIF